MSNQLIEYRTEIPIERIQFASLPFGTGNDTALISGWGVHSNAKNLSFLDEICRQIVEQTEEVKLDIWEITFTLNQFNGDVFKVNA